MLTVRQERPPQVTVQQLDYLVTIADSSTWANAAARLAVSPSALSQGIAELERRVGIKLFERVGRRRVLAPSSGPVLDYARSVIAQSHDLRRWVDNQTSGTSGLLRVGMIDAAALHYYSDTLRNFRAQYPAIDLRLTVAPSAPLLRQVQRNELDLAVIVQPSERPSDINFAPLVEDPLAIYRPKDPHLDSPGSKTSASVESDWGPWVGFPASSHTRSQIAEHLENRGIRYQVVAESNQPDVLCEMVRLGLGWTVLPVVQAEAGERPLTRAEHSVLFQRALVAAKRTTALPHPMADELLHRLSAYSVTKSPTTTT